MTKPQMIRADTIDLQDQNSPSAKDHTRKPEPSPAPMGEGPPAPHQATALKRASVDGHELASRSPRASQDLSSKELQLLHDQQSDVDEQDAAEIEQELAGRRNGDAGQDLDTDGEDDESLDDDMMDKISSSPSIDDDIDFEFVYALHTFVATVEGQANATKGDTMVLLDDSNSYWWLVRVVKDSSIGYLPAEHIETPTERLARLNKHRNIDLSQTMLGDNPEKSRNPLKKAMRRRNAKTVTFSEPTYYEASEQEYSSESENEDEMDYRDDDREDAQAQQQQQSQQQQLQEEPARVEPLNVNRSSPLKNSPIEDAMDNVRRDGDLAEDRPRTSSEVLESQQDPNQPRTQKNLGRDSFYKDESIETKKITLTPRLLSEESGPIQTTSPAQDLRARGSLEGTDKPSSIERTKDEKRKDKKPSKFGSLFKRSKDKKRGQQEDDEEWMKEARSGQLSPTPKMSSDTMSLDSQTSSPQRAQPSRQSSKLQKAPPTKSNSLRGQTIREEQQQPQQRARSVSNTAPRVESALIPDGTLTNPFEDSAAFEPQTQTQTPVQAPYQPQPLQQQQVQNHSPSQYRQPQTQFPEKTPQQEPQLQQQQQQQQQQADLSQLQQQQPSQQLQQRSFQQSQQPQQPQPPLQIRTVDNSPRTRETLTEFSSPQSDSSLRNVFSALRSSPAAPGEENRAERVKKAKERMALDDSESSSDEHNATSAFPIAPLRNAPAESHQQTTTSPSKDRLSESPVQVSPVLAPAQPPPLVGDSSSHSDGAVSPVSPSSSPELIERPTETPTSTYSASARSMAQPPQQSQPAPGAAGFPAQPPLGTLHTSTPPAQYTDPASANTTPVSTRSGRTQPEWSDAHLRQYLETAQDEIRDLMMVVRNTGEVKVDKDHHFVKSAQGDVGKFRDMEKRLDKMIVELCARHGV